MISQNTLSTAFEGSPLHRDDLRNLVCLDVWPEFGNVTHQRNHPAQILFDPVRINEQRRGRNILCIVNAIPITHPISVFLIDYS